MFVLTMYAICLFSMQNLVCKVGGRGMTFGYGVMCMLKLQEDMYSYVTVADDQQYKGKGTEVVDA